MNQWTFGSLRSPWVEDVTTGYWLESDRLSGLYLAPQSEQENITPFLVFSCAGSLPLSLSLTSCDIINYQGLPKVILLILYYSIRNQRISNLVLRHPLYTTTVFYTYLFWNKWTQLKKLMLHYRKQLSILPKLQLRQS